MKLGIEAGTIELNGALERRIVKISLAVELSPRGQHFPLELHVAKASEHQN